MATYRTRKAGRLVVIGLVGLTLGFLLGQAWDWVGGWF